VQPAFDEYAARSHILEVAIRRPVVTLHQVHRLDRRDRPTAFSQPVAKIRALLDEPQIRNVRRGVFLDTAQIMTTTLD
jgi:hypothetical protein